MKNSSRIQPLKKLASRHEQQAARVLGQSRSKLCQKQVRLQELFDYRTEYQQRFRSDAKEGIGVTQLQAYHAFMQQLDAAIAQQRLQVQEAESSLSNVSAEWRETHIRTQVLDKTIQRLDVKERRHADKINQREIDDLVGSRYCSSME